MPTNNIMQRASVVTALIFAAILLLPVPGLAQVGGGQRNSKAPSSPAGQAPVLLDEETIRSTRGQVFRLLESTPRLVEILRNDSSLLSDPQLVARHNPQLARFLEEHPEVTRNPEFYLFSQLGGLSLDKLSPRSETERERMLTRLLDDGGPFIVFLVILLAGLWLFSVLLENLRWKRVFRTQTDIYNKLLDRFSSNEEFLAYVRSEAGRRFLDSATLSFESHGEPLAGIARFLLPLRMGVVLVSVGIGFEFLHRSFGDAGTPFHVLGVIALSLGLGFVMSAVLAFGIARRFGLVPAGAAPEPLQTKQGPSAL